MLSSQVRRSQSSALTAFGRFVRAHAAVTRRLSADLQERHGLTLSDYEVLFQLAGAPEGRLRRVDLVERVLLTPSGITRLLDGLERAGLVARAECATDRRVVYAELTEDGRRRFEAARRTHLDGIRTLFAGSFRPEEIETLGELLGRLPLGAEGCAP
jgi:DNA-binding MarR family transcriptional regulator